MSPKWPKMGGMWRFPLYKPAWLGSNKLCEVTSIFEMPRLKNRTNRLCTGPFTNVTHCWWKQPFRIFGTGFDRPSAGLETAKKKRPFVS